MAAINNSFDGGTNGAVLTAANSGSASGTAFNAVSTPPAGGTLTYDTSHAAHGSLGVKVATAATAGSEYAAWTTNFGSQSDFYIRFSLYMPAAPAAAATIWRAVAGSTTCLSLNLNTAGQLRVQDSGGAVLAGTTTAALPTGQWLRVELHLVVSATAGQVELKTFNSVDGTVASNSLQTTAAQNFGAASSDGYRLGLLTSLTNFGPLWFDDYALSTSGYPGPAGTPTNTLPTVSIALATAATYGETVTATATAADADGTIVSYAWTITNAPAGSAATLSGASSASAGLHPDKTGNYGLQCVVTDNSGGTATASASIAIGATAYVWDGSNLQPGYEMVWNGSSWS